MYWIAIGLIGAVALGAAYLTYTVWSLLAREQDYDLFWDDDEF